MQSHAGNDIERLVTLQRKLARVWTMQAAHQKQRQAEGAPPPRPDDELAFLRDAQQRDMQPVFYTRMQRRFVDLVFSSRLNRSTAAPPLQEQSENARLGIRAEQLQELSEWVERCALGGVSESRAMDMLHSFGASSRAVQLLQNLKITYDSRTQGAKQVSNRLRAIRDSHPYSSALLCAFAMLWKRYNELQFCSLPLHYVENQLAALRGRFGLRAHTAVPLEACYLVVCLVCQSVYSIHNDDESSTVYNPAESFGYKDVRSDLRTGQLFCRRQVTAHQDFPQTELAHIWLLGRAVVFAGKRWILCPQPNCGMPCALSKDPRHYNDHGYSCSFHRTTPLISAKPAGKRSRRAPSAKETSA